MKKYQVFISYASENVNVAIDFSKELSNHNISNWFDKDNLYKDISKEYVNYIQDAILNSELMLLIYSKEVNSSDFIIKKEIQFAIDNNISIFCFRLDDSEMCYELSEFLQSKQWLYNLNDIDHMSQIKDSIIDENRREFLKSLVDDGITQQNVLFKDVNLFLMRIAIQRHLNIITPFGTYTQLEQSSDTYQNDELIMNVVPNSMYWPIPSLKRDKLEKLGFFKSNRAPTDVELFVMTFDNIGLISQMKSFIVREYPEIANVDAFLDEIANTTADNFIREIEDNGARFNGPMLGINDIRINRTPGEERHHLQLDFYISDYFTFKFTVELYHRLRTIKNKFEITSIDKIKYYAPFLCSLGVGGFLVVNKSITDRYLMWTKRSGTISSGEMWHFSFDETVNLYKDVIRDENGHISLFYNMMRIDPYKSFYRGIKEELGFDRSHLNGIGGILEVGLITSDRLEIELLSYMEIDVDTASSIESQMIGYTEGAIDGKLEIDQIRYIGFNDYIKEFAGKLLTPESYALSERLIYRLGKNLNKSQSRHTTIEPGAIIGDNVLIEDFCHIKNRSRIGNNCKIHRNVFIDEDVIIGDNVKIQNNISIYHGVELEDGVFVGPNVIFTNDKYPRSVNIDETLKTTSDWSVSKTIVKRGASLGGGVTLVCGVTIGEWAMIGSGAVVSRDIPAYALAFGNPATIKAWVSKSGEPMLFVKFEKDKVIMYSEIEKKEYKIDIEDYLKTE